MSYFSLCPLAEEVNGGKYCGVLCNQLFVCLKLNWKKVQKRKPEDICECSAVDIDESPSVAPFWSPKIGGENWGSDTLSLSYT